MHVNQVGGWHVQFKWKDNKCKWKWMCCSLRENASGNHLSSIVSCSRLVSFILLAWRLWFIASRCFCSIPSCNRISKQGNMKRDSLLRLLLHRVLDNAVMPSLHSLAIWDAIVLLHHCYIAFQVQLKWFNCKPLQPELQWIPCTFAPQHLFYLILLNQFQIDLI